MRSLTTLTFEVAALSAALLLAPAAGATAPPPGTALSTVPAQREPARVREAERKRAQAVAGRDVNLLRSLIGGEYYHVESNGRVRSKTEFMQMLARDDFEFRSYDIDDMDVTLLDGGRTAVVTGRILAQVQNPNRPREFRGRFVRIWALQQEGWRNILHQVTEIKPLAAPREARLQQ